MWIYRQPLAVASHSVDYYSEYRCQLVILWSQIGFELLFLKRVYHSIVLLWQSSLSVYSKYTNLIFLYYFKDCYAVESRCHNDKSHSSRTLNILPKLSWSWDNCVNYVILTIILILWPWIYKRWIFASIF